MTESRNLEIFLESYVNVNSSSLIYQENSWKKITGKRGQLKMF